MISKIRFLVILAFCAPLASPLSGQGLGVGAVVRDQFFHLVDDNGTESVVKLPPVDLVRWSPDGRRVAVGVKTAVLPGQAVSVSGIAIVERGGRDHKGSKNIFANKTNHLTTTSGQPTPETLDTI